jgi:hypothetical protein
MIHVDICATCCILSYMRHCVKCQAVIKTKAFIDGKERNLQRRKFCLECSPFGSHNTRSDIKRPSCRSLIGSDVICQVCKKEFVYNKRGNTPSRCGTCSTRIHRAELKQKCVSYKGGRCELCGYSKCLTVLEFHHKDPTVKDFGIGSNTTSRPWLILKAELDKCLCLCANCHRELHEELIREKFIVR